MAEIGHHHFESNTIFTTALTTPQVAYTIATAAQLDAAGDYILIVDAAFAMVSGSSTGNARRVALYDNDVEIGVTTSRIEPANVDATAGDPYQVVIRFTKAGSGDITLKAWNTDSVNTSVYWCNAYLILLDDLVEGTDFLHDLHTVPDPNVSAYTDGASVTLPAGVSETWLCFGGVTWETDATIEEIHKLKIVDDTTDRAEIGRDNKDVQDTFLMGTSFPISGAAGSKTVKVQYDANSAGDYERSTIFLFRTGVCKKSAVSSGGTATVVAANTFVELDTVGFTADQTGNYWMFGGGIFSAAASANRRERQLTSEIGAAGEVLQAGHADRQIQTDKIVDEIPFLLMGEAAFTNGNALTFDVDVGDKSNTTNESVIQGWIAAGTWEKAGAAGPPTPISAGGIIVNP